MSVGIAPREMTFEEYMDLPDDPKVERMLIDGILREYPKSMAHHGRPHARAMTNVAFALKAWLITQPPPHGEVLTGDMLVRLGTESRTGFGVDVVYFSADVIAAQADRDGRLVVGVPTLAVEIISPTTVAKRLDAKIDKYLSAGVPLVWEVSPKWESVRAFTSDRRSKLYNFDDTITAEGVLPGFSVPVRNFFRT